MYLKIILTMSVDLLNALYTLQTQVAEISTILRERMPLRDNEVYPMSDWSGNGTSFERDHDPISWAEDSDNEDTDSKLPHNTSNGEETKMQETGISS